MSYSTSRWLMMAFGVIYIVVGILGFVPGITQPGEQSGQGLLLGIFAVNPIHNIAHLILGAWMLWASTMRDQLTYHGKILTGVFVILAIGSFIAPLAEGLAFNYPDSGLHIATAILMGIIGWMTTAASYDTTAS